MNTQKHVSWRNISIFLLKVFCCLFVVVFFLDLWLKVVQFIYIYVLT